MKITTNILSGLLTICLTLSVSTAQAGQERAALLQRVPAPVAQTCTHYENRARFLPRGHGALLETLLADSCYSALRDLFGPGRVALQRQQDAARFMNRLVLFKTEIISLNMQRSFGRDYDADGKPHHDAGRQRLLRFAPVSATGEYLIAREMGVLSAYRIWLGGRGAQVAGLD